MREEWIAYIVKQTLQGLKYFHDQGQVSTSLRTPFVPITVVVDSTGHGYAIRRLSH